MTRAQAVWMLKNKPYKLGHLVGFNKLTKLHNKWIHEMITAKEDKTLQGHRGSYKTTCISIALAILLVVLPNKRILFIRKTDNDVKEIIRQVQNILKTPHMAYIVQCIYGVNLRLVTESAAEITTNLTTDKKGTAQLVGVGIGASLTGKHFDIIFTDDIVNINDRTSRAERDRTKIIYQELQNIKNRGGRIFNTGTPWHKDDCFSIMPDAEKYDCYSTGLIEEEELESIKERMVASLFAANYELRHVASEDVIFTSPKINGDIGMIYNAKCHIDASYGGEDWTAFTMCAKKSNTYYILGKCWQKHVDDCLDEIIDIRKKYNGGKIMCERNADKGYLAKELKSIGERTTTYHESMNKHVKISTYLKRVWPDVVFVEGTDTEYIDQICDYNENVEHDDCPDSMASIIRSYGMKNDKQSDYSPLFAI